MSIVESVNPEDLYVTLILKNGKSQRVRSLEVVDKIEMLIKEAYSRILEIDPEYEQQINIYSGKRKEKMRVYEEIWNSKGSSSETIDSMYTRYFLDGLPPSNPAHDLASIVVRNYNKKK